MVGRAALDDYLAETGWDRKDFNRCIDGWKMMTRYDYPGQGIYDVALTAEKGIATVSIAARQVELYSAKGGKPEKAEVIRDGYEERNFNNSPEVVKNGLNPRRVSDYLDTTCGGNVDSERLAEGSFFQPWGISWDGKMNKRTKKALDSTVEFLDGLERYFPGKQRRLVVMPADYYALVINGWKREVVDIFVRELEEYSDSVKARTQTNIEVVPYSRITSENRARYEEIKKGVNVSGVAEEKLRSAKKWAIGDSEEAAKAYVVERITEGILIDEIFKPVKISLGSSEKDDCDGPLPRLYLRATPTFPWIPSNWEDDGPDGMDYI